MPISVPPASKPPPSRTKLIVLGVVLGLAALVAEWSRRGELGELPETAGPASSSAGDATLPSGPLERCQRLPPGENTRLGELEPPADGEEPDRFAPFAIAVGRAVDDHAGFAVGALLDAEGGTIANVVRLSSEGGIRSVVRLARSRGDMEPPAVASAGERLLSAFLEPTASGRDLRVVAVDGDELRWGPTFSQGRDESLAVDIAVSGKRGAVAWDDVPEDEEASVVVMSTFSVEELGGATEVRIMTDPQRDAETPRLVPKSDGFWLVYQVLGSPSANRIADPQERDVYDEDEVDERKGGQTLLHAHLEVMPVDAFGNPQGGAQPVTPVGGHTVAFDVRALDEDRLLVAYRDERTPVGGGGGTVHLARVEAGGIHDLGIVATEDVTGAPSLLAGFLSLSSYEDDVKLSPLSGAGELAGPLLVESAFGRDQILAAHGSRVLVGRSEGRSMVFSTVDCAGTVDQAALEKREAFGGAGVTPTESLGNASLPPGVDPPPQPDLPPESDLPPEVEASPLELPPEQEPQL